MDWTRTEKVNHDGRLGPTLDIPLPPRKEFVNMLELLKDAEKYNSQEEDRISIGILENLKTYINEYISKKKMQVNKKE